MSRELSVKHNEFWRLLNREQFLWEYFQARLRYRIPRTDNSHFYIEIVCNDSTICEHAEQYIKSYIEPKHTRLISSPSHNNQKFCDHRLLNRLMREYVVHIDAQYEDQSNKIIFHSLSLTVLYLAIDDFVKSTLDATNPNSSMVENAQSVLRSLSNTFENQWNIFNELDDEHQEFTVISQSKDDESQSNFAQASSSSSPSSQHLGPQLKIAFPGSEIQPHETNINELVVKKRQKSSTKGSRRQQPSSSNNTDNELVREMRQKLKGRDLRDVIIDGANIGRTYGDPEFSSRGIKLAVDLFQSYGYPDSKIVTIIPQHYLAKDRDGVFPELARRKILHKAFHQKIDDQIRRFYDDRLIVDLAVMRQGIILSNDFYRDLMRDSGDAVRKAIKERLLCYRFIGDDLCLPNPVSEGGFALDVFLSK